MRAFQVTKLGQTPTLQEAAEPVPGPGEVTIKIKACALNFADLLMVEGTYQEKPELPFSLGMEMAGTISALGPDVTSLPVGTRVAAFSGHGGLADFATVPVERCIPIPYEMSNTDAAAFIVGYGTAHLALDHRAKLQANETLLVLGAAGGVGLTAVELGKAMGARVIACARGADKLKICADAGADHLIDSETQDIRQTVKDLGGADVVYDPVGGDQFNAALRACNPEARMVVVGFASGDVPPVPANVILVKNITVIGYYWGGYLKFAPHIIRQSLETLFEWHASGRIAPHISHKLPLERAAEGLELLRSRKSTGKVVIEI